MGRGPKVGWLTAVLLVVVGALVATTVSAAPAKKVTKVGFASPEKPNDYGWNQQGFTGAQAAAKSQGASVIASTGIGYENVEPVLRRLAQRGANLIIAHASGYNTVAPKVAQQYHVPTIVWDNPKAVQKGLVSNVITAAQQGAYLAGVLAAQVTKTGFVFVFYVAGKPSGRQGSMSETVLAVTAGGPGNGVSAAASGAYRSAPISSAKPSARL